MRRFASLIESLDTTNKTNKKVDELAKYFKEVSKKDYFLDFSVAPKKSRFIRATFSREIPLGH